MASPSVLFLEVLAEHRDRLYARARAHAGSVGAESALVDAMRKTITESAGRPGMNVLRAIESRLGSESGATDETVMPADVLARVSAAITVAAEESVAGVSTTERAHLKDPLLAPKKHKRSREPRDGLGLSPLVRFLLAAVIAVVVGVIVTMVVLGRG